ncbi:MAG: hypothetical protein EHM48_05200 [Planctomycetaceae bacterium]|nr:MAG: hypothetical protein EHM48_05200 [Planctomycetaceae bacterium]
MHQLIDLLSKFNAPRVALMGDFILDRYVYGDVDRINPEAPVPVLRTVRANSSVGGAGNVAAAVPAMGAKVTCVGVIGNDQAGEELNRVGLELLALANWLPERTALEDRLRLNDFILPGPPPDSHEP